MGTDGTKNLQRPLVPITSHTHHTRFGLQWRTSPVQSWQKIAQETLVKPLQGLLSPRREGEELHDEKKNRKKGENKEKKIKKKEKKKEQAVTSRGKQEEAATPSPLACRGLFLLPLACRGLSRLILAFSCLPRLVAAYSCFLLFAAACRSLLLFSLACHDLSWPVLPCRGLSRLALVFSCLPRQAAASKTKKTAYIKSSSYVSFIKKWQIKCCIAKNGSNDFREYGVFVKNNAWSLRVENPTEHYVELNMERNAKFCPQFAPILIGWYNLLLIWNGTAWNRNEQG